LTDRYTIEDRRFPMTKNSQKRQDNITKNNQNQNMAGKVTT